MPPQDTAPLRHDPPEEFLGEPRLPDTSFALYEDDSTDSLVHRLPRFDQSGPFVLPSDEAGLE